MIFPRRSIPVPSKRAFTLLELVAVVAIIAIIAVFAARKSGTAVREAKIGAARHDMKTIASAISGAEGSYIADMQGIPGFSAAYMRLSNLLFPTNVYGAVQYGREGTVGVRIDTGARRDGVADESFFLSWNPDSGKGWNGPYLSCSTMPFPDRDSRRSSGDATFGERGFYPELSGLWLPRDFTSGLSGCSIYGFPGELVPADPWGNPYVIQIPPAQAFSSQPTNVADSVRFRYARIVCAGPDGMLDTPCYSLNRTNSYSNAWSKRERRLSRQAGLADGDSSARGDDIVLFLSRADIDEGEEYP